MRTMNRRPRFGEAKPEREKIAFPLTVEPYRSYDAVDQPYQSSSKAMQMREHMPYLAGEMFFFNDGTDREPDIKLARVVRCFWERRERYGDYIPKWRIQIATKDGHWSGTWKYTFPGFIFRAYHDHKENPRTLPTIVNTLAECRVTP